MGQRRLWEASQRDLKRAGADHPVALGTLGAEVLFCSCHIKNKRKGKKASVCMGCCAPVLSHSRSLGPCPPWDALSREKAGGSSRAPGGSSSSIPSPCPVSPGRWEQLLRRCSTLGADELFKVVICQALMSPDRACEN